MGIEARVENKEVKKGKGLSRLLHNCDVKGSLTCGN